MSQPVIIAACRTPIGKFGKSLVGVSATALGGAAIEEALRRAGVREARVDELEIGDDV